MHMDARFVHILCQYLTDIEEKLFAPVWTLSLDKEKQLFSHVKVYHHFSMNMTKADVHTNYERRLLVTIIQFSYQTGVILMTDRYELIHRTQASLGLMIAIPNWYCISSLHLPLSDLCEDYTIRTTTWKMHSYHSRHLDHFVLLLIVPYPRHYRWNGHWVLFRRYMSSNVDNRQPSICCEFHHSRETMVNKT